MRTHNMRQFDTMLPDLNGKSIMITGGSGSFGMSFIKQIVKQYKPRRLIVFSRDEYKQFMMAQSLQGPEYNCMRYFIGDVRDVERLEMAMSRVNIVIHAAALKHVSVAEYNPFECIKTNVYGAENVVRAALRTGVEKVIALSTDKAANPANLYGASKLASDKIFIAANSLSGEDGATFSVVRYGNVIGSRGSVFPFFQKLAAEGATEIPITDARMSRFWVTVEQSVNFVLSSLQLMRGGEIFVPKIPSMKVVDIAKTLAPEASLRFIGIRPGEKLHEVMITDDDARTTLELDDRFVIEPQYFSKERADLVVEAKPVPNDFRYASDTNGEWLDSNDLSALIKSTKVWS